MCSTKASKPLLKTESSVYLRLVDVVNTSCKQQNVHHSRTMRYLSYTAHIWAEIQHCFTKAKTTKFKQNNKKKHIHTLTVKSIKLSLRFNRALTDFFIWNNFFSYFFFVFWSHSCGSFHSENFACMCLPFEIRFKENGQFVNAFNWTKFARNMMMNQCDMPHAHSNTDQNIWTNVKVTNPLTH